MGIKNYGVVDLLSVGLVVLAQPVGCKGRAHVSTRRIDCGRGRFSARRTGRLDLGGAGRALVTDERARRWMWSSILVMSAGCVMSISKARFSGSSYSNDIRSQDLNLYGLNTSLFNPFADMFCQLSRRICTTEIDYGYFLCS